MGFLQSQLRDLVFAFLLAALTTFSSAETFSLNKIEVPKNWKKYESQILTEMINFFRKNGHEFDQKNNTGKRVTVEITKNRKQYIYKVEIGDKFKKGKVRDIDKFLKYFVLELNQLSQKSKQGIRVTSSPPGATLYINKIQTEYKTISDLAPLYELKPDIEYQVQVSKNKYIDSVPRKIKLKENEEKPIHFKLILEKNKNFGYLMILSDPPNAKIILKGRKIGKAGDKIRLKKGKYNFMLTKVGYKDTFVETYIHGLKENNLEVNLPSEGELKKSRFKKKKGSYYFYSSLSQNFGGLRFNDKQSLSSGAIELDVGIHNIDSGDKLGIAGNKLSLHDELVESQSILSLFFIYRVRLVSLNVFGLRPWMENYGYKNDSSVDLLIGIGRSLIEKVNIGSESVEVFLIGLNYHINGIFKLGVRWEQALGTVDPPYHNSGSRPQALTLNLGMGWML